MNPTGMNSQGINPHRVLLLEDDPNLGVVLSDHLRMQGFDVTLCVNGQEGIETFDSTQFDLCLVDIMMPKKDGFEFAREIRLKDQQIPLIFLTAKSLKEDRIEGFKIGCDDYIIKPFSVEELLLRVQAVLKRSKGDLLSREQKRDFEIGSYHFDYNRRILVLKGSKKSNQSERKLTTKEAELLRLLCLKVNSTLDRQIALKEIWGEDSYFSGRSMDVFISKLRKYLNQDEKVEILGVHGKGFRLVVS